MFHVPQPRLQIRRGQPGCHLLQSGSIVVSVPSKSKPMLPSFAAMRDDSLLPIRNSVDVRCVPASGISLRLHDVIGVTPCTPPGFNRKSIPGFNCKLRICAMLFRKHEPWSDHGSQHREGREYSFICKRTQAELQRIARLRATLQTSEEATSGTPCWRLKGTLKRPTSFQLPEASRPTPFSTKSGLEILRKVWQ